MSFSFLPPFLINGRDVRSLRQKSWWHVTQAPFYTHRRSTCDVMDCTLPMINGVCLNLLESPVTLILHIINTKTEHLVPLLREPGCIRNLRYFSDIIFVCYFILTDVSKFAVLGKSTFLRHWCVCRLHFEEGICCWNPIIYFLKSVLYELASCIKAF